MSNINNRKRHIIIIKGGFGNQLFIHYFSLYLKNKFPNDIVLCETRAYFWLEYKYKAKFKLDNLGLKFSKNKLIGSFKMLFYIIIINIFSINFLNKIFQSKKIIDDQNLNKLDEYYSENNKFIYNGYFQDYKIVDSIYKKNKISFKHYFLSNKYKLLENKINKDFNSIAFCIRNFNMPENPRFNYPIKRFNALIRLIIKENKDCKFYIFAYKNFKNKRYIFPENSEFITHENGYSDDKAILKLISRCNIKVISNSSTFYWMAAYSSIYGNKNTDKNKIYISENYGLKHQLCPPRWINF